MRASVLTRLVAIGAALLPAAAVAGGGPSCQGQPATRIGSQGDDILYGTAADDVIVGRGGDDFIDGGRGRDLVCGGPGRDHVAGGESRDQIRGGRDDDILGLARAESGAVVRLGRPGRPFGVARARGLGRDAVIGVEDSYGTAFPDLLAGTRGDNRLLGIGAKDELYGYGGDDFLKGGGGPDRAYGGRGDDVCKSAWKRRSCES